MKSDLNLVLLASESASSLEGVTGLALDAEGLRNNILVRDVIKEGVKLSRDKEGNISLDVYIRVKYGTKIPQLAWELQRKIQEDIKNKTDVLVSDINVHVEGVDLEAEHEKK